MSFNLTVFNHKGGVAKTTTAVSLASALAERGYRVLLVDMDPQANLTLSLGIQPDEVRFTLANLMMGNMTPPDVIQPVRQGSLDVIPSNVHLRMVERFLPVRERYEFTTQTMLAAIPGYHFHVLDCPAILGPLTLNAIAAADLALIPTQCEPFSLYSLREALEFYREQRTRLALPADNLRILPTLVAKRNRVHQEGLERLQREQGDVVLQTHINMDTKLRESQERGVPILYYKPRSRAAGQYRQLASELFD